MPPFLSNTIMTKFRFGCESKEQGHNKQRGIEANPYGLQNQNQKFPKYLQNTSETCLVQKLIQCQFCRQQNWSPGFVHAKTVTMSVSVDEMPRHQNNFRRSILVLVLRSRMDWPEHTQVSPFSAKTESFRSKFSTHSAAKSRRQEKPFKSA